MIRVSDGSLYNDYDFTVEATERPFEDPGIEMDGEENEEEEPVEEPEEEEIEEK